ncbi:aminotransferase class V-fold PLP-dependent enzyme [archaeon]|nr:aminotransferase class V-fold PLP-dependent enzyme [archaeon]
MARINWNEPRFDKEDLKEVIEVIETSYVNEGPKTKELEEKFREYLGVKHVIFTTNATAALFLALKADAIIRGIKDFEVIVPDMTMIATATAVSWAGGKVVLADVEKDRMTIDPEEIKKKISPKTTAILPVHIIGRAPDMAALQRIAQEENLTIIEDAAGALGSKNRDGRFLGTIGKVGCFSLQSNKLVTCGQGGVIVTDDDQYYEAIRRLRDFGRLSNKEFLHEEVGYNLKFNDLSAALALSQFRKLEERKELMVSQRNQYESELKSIEKIAFPRTDLNFGEIPLWVEIFAEERDELIEYLKASEIYARPCWPAIHRNPPYRNQGNNEDYPNASSISDNVLWLPNGPAISPEQITFISNKIKEFYNREKPPIKLEKIHEDKRGSIHLVEDLLPSDKEFTFLEINKGYARGGCLHSNDEHLVVVKGKIRFICGEEETIVGMGESARIPANRAHAFIALEDSVVSEWGITSEEKNHDAKDPQLRALVDEINESQNF